MDAEIPQTTVIDKKKASFKATYDGEPKFEKVSGTSMDYAVNTPDQIIKDGDKYYAVDQGVWYVADKPEGPYKVADKRPKDIDQIPPDNPNYNTKYVYVYDSDDDTVTSGYTAGYLGAFLIGTTMGAAMTWGTGYYYRPWYGSYYYSRPWSYGYGAYYNSNTGGWGYRGPNGGAWYRPSGGYYGGNGYWGAGGYRNIDVGDINVGEININRDRTTNNLYNLQNNLNRNADSGRLAQRDKNQLNKLGERGPSAGRDSSKLAGDRPNNVFADKDGNVFQRNQDGKWQERQGKEWKDTEVPQGLKDKAASREAGGLSDKDQGMKDRQPGESGLKDKAGGLKDNKVQGKDLSDKAGNLKARNPNPSAKQGQLANRPAAANRQPANFDRGNMERQHQARDHGNARAQNYQSYQSNRNMASRPSSGGTDRGGGGNLNRGGGGSRGGGGFQGGGGGGGRSRGGGGGGRRR
ncbi:MAG: hypothetical protein K8R69_04155, partial [Deltaproteobacteria bacterium]|nr:hypothetical protein [Deltaproteobacteria bacterium]